MELAPIDGRRERKKRRTRREIFDAAMRLFEARGFDAVTLEEICGAADVARATFFLHFPSKSALLHEKGRELATQLAAHLAEPHGSAVAEYRSLVEFLGERWLRQADVMGPMLRELIRAPGGGEAGRDLCAIVEDVVRRGQQRGEFRRTVSPRLAAAMLLTTAAAILSGQVYREGEASAAEVRNQFLHALLHGLLEERKPRLKWSPGAGGRR